MGHRSWSTPIAAYGLVAPQLITLAAMENSADPPGNEVLGSVPVHELFRRRAAANPGALAVTADDGVLNYEELDVRSDVLAGRLAALGVGREDVVGIYLERSTAFVIAALAILKVGAAYLPVDMSYPDERVRMMLIDADARALVTRAELQRRAPSGGWPLLAIDDQTGDRAAPLSERSASLEDLAYVIYTSGSTGQPKGVEVTHGNLLNLVRWHVEAFDVTATDRASQLASLAFDAAVWEIWPYLSMGASVHVVPDDAATTPEPLRDWLLLAGVTIAFVPTPLAEAALDLLWPASAPLRTMLTGGDTLHRHPPAGLPFTLINNYGPTEATVVATSGPVYPDPAPAGRPDIGRAITGARLQVLDEQRNEVPVGGVGELFVGGAGVARGYRNQPLLTAERFVPDISGGEPGAHLYRTGDLVRRLLDGRLEFVGRGDHQVKIRGHRVEPDEITAVLREHPSVEAGIVVAREHGSGELRLAAYFVPRNCSILSAGELRRHLSERLPDYMVPVDFVRLDELPVTTSGKVDRGALPAPDPAAERIIGAPRTPAEEAIAAILAELLKVERVGVDENFFELGGHSLLGAQIIARVRERFAVDMTLRAIFESPTVAGMAARVEALMIEKLEEMGDAEVERILAADGAA